MQIKFYKTRTLCIFNYILLCSKCIDMSSSVFNVKNNYYDLYFNWEIKYIIILCCLINCVRQFIILYQFKSLQNVYVSPVVIKIHLSII